MLHCGSHSDGNDGTPVCSCCLRLPRHGTPEHKRVNDISSLCFECLPSAVLTDAHAMALYDNVGAFFKRMGAWGAGLTLPPLRLLNQRQMRGLRYKSISVHASGVGAGFLLGLCATSHSGKEVVKRDGVDRFGMRRVGVRVVYIALQSGAPPMLATSLSFA